jgi:hypothetical protein
MCVRDGKSHEAGGEGDQWCPVEKHEREQRGACGDRKVEGATPQYEGMIGIARGEDAEPGFPVLAEMPSGSDTIFVLSSFATLAHRPPCLASRAKLSLASRKISSSRATIGR